MIWVVTIHLESSSLDVLSNFVVDIDDLVIVHPGLFEWLNQDIVRFNISVDKTKRVEVFHHFNHLNAQLKNIDLLEVFLVFIENRIQTFAQFVLY